MNDLFCFLSTFIISQRLFVRREVILSGSFNLGFCTIARYGHVYNGHIMFIYIYIEHRNLEIRKTRKEFFVQVRNFLLPLSLKVLRHKKREAQSFYSGFFICPHNTCGTRHKGLREQANVKRLPWGRSHLNLLTFSKSHKILRVLLVRDVIRTRLPPFPISGYYDISEWHVRSAHARVRTPVLMLHLTNPCAEPKGSQPN